MSLKCFSELFTSVRLGGGLAGRRAGKGQDREGGAWRVRERESGLLRRSRHVLAEQNDTAAAGLAMAAGRVRVVEAMMVSVEGSVVVRAATAWFLAELAVVARFMDRGIRGGALARQRPSRAGSHPNGRPIRAETRAKLVASIAHGGSAYRLDPGRCNSGLRQERVWRAQRPGAENRRYRDLRRGRDRTPLV